MKVNKFTKIKKARLVEIFPDLPKDLLTIYRVEGIYQIHNPHLTSILSIKIRDLESRLIRYVPFSDLKITNTYKFKDKFEFIEVREKDEED